MNKGTLSNALRALRLIYWTDWLRYVLEKWNNRHSNCTFLRDHPGVAIPPDYLLYESYRLDYSKYFSQGKETAQWIAGHLEKYMDFDGKKILDWGCGPGRVLRHLPEVLGPSCVLHGTDYNLRSIEWCRTNLPGISFNHNALEANLPYPDGFFDAIYGISILTHLSEPMHYAWVAELLRVLSPGGVLFLTAQGDAFKIKMTSSELEAYQRGELVVRGKVKEGHRTYSAFHPRPFMEKLFEKTQVLEHIAPPAEKGKGLAQDVWILKK